MQKTKKKKMAKQLSTSDLKKVLGGARAGKISNNTVGFDASDWLDNSN